MLRLLVMARESEAEELARELGQRGFNPTVVADPETAVSWLEQESSALLFLDGDAFPPSTPAVGRLLSLAREKGGAILALFASPPNEETAPGVACDDFALRPASVAELVARLHRLSRQQGLLPGNRAIRAGDLTIDPERYEVTVAGRLVDLTYKEYQLLHFLATHPERVFSREALLNQVWGYDYFGGTRTVDVHVRRLRSKLEDPTHQFIETLRNIGYRFRTGQARAAGTKPPD